MYLPILPILAISLLFTPSSYANGTEYWETCSDIKQYQGIKVWKAGYLLGYCIGTIEGSTESLFAQNPESIKLCPPEGGLKIELVRMTLNNYLESNPNKRHLPLSTLILSALLIAFPCGPT